MLAINIYKKQKNRGMEKIPRREVVPFAKQWNIEYDEWKLTGRSLLNRDSEGNCKFAHRSIMEFLFTVQLAKNEKNRQNIILTDLMIQFIIEIFQGAGQECIENSKIRKSIFRNLI